MDIKNLMKYSSGISEWENHLSMFFFKQKTAYEMLLGDWSSDVCSSDLADLGLYFGEGGEFQQVSQSFREFQVTGQGKQPWIAGLVGVILLPSGKG